MTKNTCSAVLGTLIKAGHRLGKAVNIRPTSDALSSGPPKVPPVAKFNQFTKPEGEGFAVLCEAQGYPVPVFR